MRIKVLVLSLVMITLSVAMSSTTMSYLMNMESVSAVFTVGNVKIENITETSGVCENLQKGDTCIKTVAVDNTGTVDAYVRVRVLVPESLVSVDSPIINVITANDEFTESAETIYCDGVSGELCKEFTTTWEDRLAGNTATEQRSISFEYEADATVEVEGENVEGESTSLATLDINIYTEAIQAQGFVNAAEAFNNF